MSKAAREDEAAVLERLDRIELLLAELVRRKRADKRAGGKRSQSVAERAASTVRYRPTDLEMARARRRLRGL